MIEPITVCTATKNRKSLYRTVQSVQAQTLAPARHCILFQQMMESPFIDLPKPTRVPIDIHWLPPPQPSFVDVYNMAEEMAETPWIAMLDDDCWWEPEHLAKLAALMETSGADFVWASSMLHHEQDGEAFAIRDDPTPAFQHIDTNEILFKRHCRERWGGFSIEEHRRPDGRPIEARVPGGANYAHSGIDGRRIERWVQGGATSAHSPFVTVHYTWRPPPPLAEAAS